MEQYKNSSAERYLQLPIADKTVTSEFSGDFTLPDYQPEIKRLLRVTASPLPASKYVGGDGVELSGNIDYFVLYMGSDSQLYCAPLNSEYKIQFPVDANTDGIGSPSVAANITPELVSGRVTSPRKLNIKCRLSAQARVFGEMALDDGSRYKDDSIQVLSGERSTMGSLFGVADKLDLSDEIICDAKDGDTRVIFAEGKVLMNEVNSASDKINCRGDLYLKLLLCREPDGVPYTSLRKLPFFTSVPINGIESGDCACAKGSVCELNITVDEGRIAIDAGVIIEGEAKHKATLPYVKDIYSTESITECDYTTVKTCGDGTLFNSNFTLSDSVSMNDIGAKSDSKIIDASARISPEEYSFDGDRCTVSGKAKFNLLTFKDGEYAPVDIELPFKYETQAKGAESAYSHAEAVYTRVRADGERIGIDSEICIVGGAERSQDMTMLNSASFGESYERGRGEILVCYPSNEDSLWSIAKRYGVGVDDLAQRNKLQCSCSPDEAGSLENVSCLVI